MRRGERRCTGRNIRLAFNTDRPNLGPFNNIFGTGLCLLFGTASANLNNSCAGGGFLSTDSAVLVMDWVRAPHHQRVFVPDTIDEGAFIRSSGVVEELEGLCN